MVLIVEPHTAVALTGGGSAVAATPHVAAEVTSADTAAVFVPDDQSLERIRRAVAILGLAGMFYPRRPAMAAGPVFEVEALLRRLPGLHGAVAFAETCRRAGMREAAMFLEDSSAWARVDRLAASSLDCVESLGFLAAGDGSFPAALRDRVPVLWCREHLRSASEFVFSDPSIPVSVVGSRSPSPAAARFSSALGVTLARSGFALVSGGAPGIDRIAAAAYLRAEGSDLTEFWPCGLLRPWSAVMDASDVWAEPEFEGGRRIRALSAAAPDEPFSAARAMERNGFIYAAGLVTVVVEARLREGGTWHGAVSALRRGERVMVYLGEGEEGEAEWSRGEDVEDVEDGWGEDEAKWRRSAADEDGLMETETISSDRENGVQRAARALCALGAIPVHSERDVVAFLTEPKPGSIGPGIGSLFEPDHIR